MKIKFLAADSLGVRSMATFVETSDTTILIDPAAALGPRRYGLPPHKLEKEALEYSWQKISEASEESEVIIVTHYHYDHHSRKRNVEIYKNKLLLIKDPNSFINRSQRWRAYAFLESIKELPSEIAIADGKELFIGNTQVVFSRPVFHGEPKSKLGFVLEVFISDSNKSFIFSSDVEGLLDESQIDFILRMKADIVYLDGPPTYLGSKKMDQLLHISQTNIERVVRLVRPQFLIIDHHLTRDLNFKAYFEGFNNFITAAEFMGQNPNLLEARRKELWNE
ncbi:MAG: hypothetical protein NDP13_03530 [Crenarchaeota archaeon]|nr:hypothetical protein [Thermoproteota archaeon]MCR8454041.1 hypothetical protein [Thermoproteota archaeon]MCR8463377.1 hypothetical protein [Thermoproteota archaeon]MCR8470420.1 hypothetical protein [Thermoproteota archaeon]MCR8471437.1 hypothetical protein [Thermoproteota archaeon]